MTTNENLPLHKRPTSCHVCGSGPHPDGAGDGHTYWSNADALAEATEHDRQSTVRYSSGATTPEAAYVAQHRPY